MAAAAATVALSGDAAVQVRLALMGVGDTPMRMSDIEAQLNGAPLSGETIEAAAVSVGGAVDPMSDLHASSDYRRHLAQILTKRVLRDAWQRPEALPNECALRHQSERQWRIARSLR